MGPPGSVTPLIVLKLNFAGNRAGGDGRRGLTELGADLATEPEGEELRRQVIAARNLGGRTGLQGANLGRPQAHDGREKLGQTHVDALRMDGV